MPAYKDKVERMTPEQLAEFILKERVCKNCKWWSLGGYCVKYEINEYIQRFGNGHYIKFEPPEIFGCTLWEKRDE